MSQRKPASVTRLHSTTKLFVLDTNVLMHDPTSLFRFEEHDIFLPMATIEELDANKKGMSEVSRNARQVSRFLDGLLNQSEAEIDNGIPLAAQGDKQASGRMFLQTQAINMELPSTLASGKADNQILAVVRHLHETYPRRQVILVSKDINMRIKARALGLSTEDYFNDKVLEDTDLLYTGIRELPADFWDTHGKEMESWQQAGRTFYRVHGPLCTSLLVNEFVFQENDRPFYAQVKELSGKTAVLQTLVEHTHQRNGVWGITARNRDEPRCRLHHTAGSGRHRQDSPDPGRRIDADARGQDLFRDHHDSGHRAGGRGHRLPSRYRGGKDDTVDGCAGRQPGRTQQDGRGSRRVGSRCHP
jgi:PhoH-like ATPase